MTASFLITPKWLADFSDDPLERANRAELTILVDGICSTEVADSLNNEIRTAVRLSPLYLSEWLANNWWRLRWEPEIPGTPHPETRLDWEMSHNMASIGGGYIWPPMTFSSRGDTVSVQSRPTGSTPSETIRYERRFDREILASDFEKEIDKLIDITLDKLSGATSDRTNLPGLWAEVNTERADPELTEIRKLEAFMGFDAGEAPEQLIDGIQEQVRRYGTSSVQEFATSSKSHALSDLESLGDEIASRGSLVVMPDREPVNRELNENALQFQTTWSRAERAARVARSRWNISKGPVTNEVLANLISVRPDQLSISASPVSVGLRQDGAVDRVRCCLRQRSGTGRRFYLARLVGDHLISPEGEQLMVATDAKTTRQQFQRAFAREFLCPFDDLQEFIGDGKPNSDVIDAAAEQFQLSSWAVALTLVNKGVLEREALDEWSMA